MLKGTGTLFCSLALAATGCTSKVGIDPPPPETESLPQAITMVASGNFEQPGDAVSSHDGAVFFFTAYHQVDDEPVAAIMKTPSNGGTAQAIHTGAPLGAPTGLVLSCDGETLYVADRGMEMDDEDAETTEDLGGIFSVSTLDGSISQLSADGIASPAGMALSVDCNTLYISGWNDAGEPALFTVSTDGGSVATVMAGAPLVSPTGLHVDKDSVAWVMDHLAIGANGPGVLFAIDANGAATEVISDLKMGTPGGVSLNSSGTTAFIPTRDENGEGQLTAVRLADGQVNQVPATNLVDPAGIRTARNASVFAVVDSESGAIFSAK